MRSQRHLVCLLLGLSSTAVLACEQPTVPILPDDDERLRGRAERALKDEVRGYITGMSVYVACVQAEYRAADTDAVLELNRELLANRNNRAVAELEAFRDLYVASVGPLEALFFDQSGGAPGPVGESGSARMLLPGETYKYHLDRIRENGPGPAGTTDFVGAGVE